MQKEENPSDMKLLGFVLVAWTVFTVIPNSLSKNDE
jgi:succinate-acetate transporter protein